MRKEMKNNKGRVLKYLRENLPILNILPIYMVNGKKFYEDKYDVADDIRKELCDYTKCIVRSSSSNEDTACVSNAGKFESILNVDISSLEDLSKAIDTVFRSYGMLDDSEEVLIQPMLENVIKSGVVFTVDIETFADYYTVNYQNGNDTEAVTSGHSNNISTYICYKNTPLPIRDADMENLLAACRNIETFLGNNALDIEFGINNKHEVYIFQVRPIVKGKKKKYGHVELDMPLNRIYKKISKLGKRHPFLLGEKTFFGVMPDWNPAEILGLRPKKLALSLYKELITDSVWAYQRRDYGYRDVSMHPLMASFFGIPYIDTRITFNSFVPNELEDELAEKLVNYYLKKLETSPEYHDKIEFNIVFSCYYVGIENDLKELLVDDFTKEDIEKVADSLLNLTKNIINPHNGLYKDDLGKLSILKNKYNSIITSELSTVDKIYWLIEECKKYGTLPFAGVARAAFVAIQILNSLVKNEIITSGEKEKFLLSLNTVAKLMKQDVMQMNSGKLSQEVFLQRYGHIRPGTYDILSPRYDEAFDVYFEHNNMYNQDNKNVNFHLSFDAILQIDNILQECRLGLSASDLFTFIREAVEGRELLKFEFTKCVSEILRLIEKLGVRVGINKEDMSFLDISAIKNLYLDLYYGSVKEVLKDNIDNNKKQYVFLEQLKLPALILSPEMIYEFDLLNEEPNYITQKQVTAKVIRENIKDVDLEGKIVFIPSADPGYDFLFDKQIGGLITQFGGANSHMAIRCAEMGIPAVIGAGEKNFKYWSRADVLRIDCQKKQVILLGL